MNQNQLTEVSFVTTVTIIDPSEETVNGKTFKAGETAKVSERTAALLVENGSATRGEAPTAPDAPSPAA